jgi:hypothetical protein
MIGLSQQRGEKFRNFVKRRHRCRSDKELGALMARQEELLASIERTRRSRGLSIERFAFAAGVSERGYRKAISGLVLVRATTIAKLRRAQRQAAAGALT